MIIFERFENKLEDLKQNRVGNQNEDLAKLIEETVEGFEIFLNSQRKELEEKNAQIKGLELRLSVLEKKVFRQLENK